MLNLKGSVDHKEVVTVVLLESIKPQGQLFLHVVPEISQYCKTLYKSTKLLSNQILLDLPRRFPSPNRA